MKCVITQKSSSRGLIIKNLRDFFTFEKSDNFYFQLTRFILVGGFTAGIDFLLLVGLVEIFLLHYLAASGTAFVIAVTINYYLSRQWVFWGGKYSNMVEFIGFFATSGAGLALNQLIMWFFVDTIHLDYKLTKIISIAIVTIWNYLTKKFLIFGKNRPKQEYQ